MAGGMQHIDIVKMNSKLRYWFLFFVSGKKKATTFAIEQQKLSVKKKNMNWLYWNERITSDTERKHFLAIFLFILLAYINWLLIVYI